MCWRCGCPTAGDKKALQVEDEGDDITKLLIIGASGMTGSAVLQAACSCAWFQIFAFTRDKEENYKELQQQPIAAVRVGDMLHIDSLIAAMEGVDTVFFVTTYFDHMDVDKEFEQGKNVIEAAKKCSIKHIMYLGTNYNILTAKERCLCLEGKAKVENYLVDSGLPYTIIHTGFYFENFVSVFKPHQTSAKEFAVALPMGGNAMNCGSAFDFGQCIVKIAMRPHNFIFKTVRLSAAYLTVTEMAKALDNQFPTLKFYNPHISIQAYRSFKFSGAMELCSMFVHYRSYVDVWDTSQAIALFNGLRSFEQWVKDKDRLILEAIFESTIFEVPDYRKHLQSVATPYRCRGEQMLTRFFKGILSWGSQVTSSRQPTSQPMDDDEPEIGPGDVTALLAAERTAFQQEEIREYQRQMVIAHSLGTTGRGIDMDSDSSVETSVK